MSTDNTNYYFKIRSIDGNNYISDSSCSAGIAVSTDTTPPVNATGLAWDSSAYSDGVGIATWTPSASSDLAAQTVRGYTDASCSVQASQTVVLGAAATSSAIGVTAGNTSYWFDIESTDNKGNSATSLCVSSSMAVTDSTAPEGATFPSWIEGGTSTSYTITGQWTVSSSKDIGSQEMHVFTNGTCSSAYGSPITGLSATVSSTAFTVAADDIYYFKIKSVDGAGLSDWSSCSAGINVVLGATRPGDPIGLNFTAGTDINVNWSSGGGTTFGFIVIRDTSPINFTPVDGTSYALGSNNIVCKTTSTSCSDSGISGASLYYYAVYAYNSTDDYSSKIEDGVLTPTDLNEHRYYRLKITSLSGSAGYAKISNLQFQWDNTWQSNDISSDFVGSIGGNTATADASGNYSGSSQYAAYNAFDSSSSSQWVGAQNQFETSGDYNHNSSFAWLGVDFGSGDAETITGMKVTGWVGGGNDGSPDDYILQYSDNGSSWTDIASSAVTGANTSNATHTHTFGGTATPQTEPNAPISLSLNGGSSGELGISYADGGGDTAEYLVVRREGSAPDFSPTDGVVYAADTWDGDNYIVARISSVSMTDTTVTDGNTYHYDVYALDAFENYSVKVSGSFTLGGCSGVTVGGYCWYLSDADSCTNTCSSRGGYNEATRTYAGSDGSNSNCEAVLDALGGSDNSASNTSSYSNGCHIYSGSYYRDTSTTTAGADNGADRACACNN